MIVGLFDESNLLEVPNLAIARCAGYHRARGDEVHHNRLGPRCDRAYVSCIFPANWRRMQVVLNQIKAGEVLVGGTGHALAAGVEPPWTKLPPEIEAAEPDFSPWPDWPWSLGFSYRGCVRNCDFCVVPRKEGQRVTRAAGCCRELLRPEAREDPQGHHLVDMANNVLAAPEQELEQLWREVRELGITVDYCQGFDVRLITQAIAEELAALPLYVRWRDWGGRWQKRRRMFLALDHSGLTAQFERAARWLLKAGVAQSSIYVFVLERPDQEADALARVRAVAALGLRPYVMPLDDYQDAGLRRWANHRYYQFVPWEKYRWRRRGQLPLPAGVAASRVPQGQMCAELDTTRGYDNGIISL